MPTQPGVTNPDPHPGTDERGIPLENLQAEFSRKLEELKGETNSKYDALMQKLDSLTVADEPPLEKTDAGYSPREELVKISADPRRYVEEKTKPLEEKAALLEKELLVQRKATLTAQWERMEDRIARSEKKGDWNEVPEEFRKEIHKEITSRGWQGNPASAMDAYEIVKARRTNVDHSDPDRLARIRASQTEGGGRGTGSTGSIRGISKEMLTEISRTPPSHPDYKKNMETLDKVQKGHVKIEG